MGLAISWIAAKGGGRAETLAALGLAEAGARALAEPVPPPPKLSAFERDGWLFLVSSDCDFASRARVAAASQGGLAVGAYLEEHVMVSGAFGASDGRLVWSVQHDPEHGLEHLEVWGEPPAELTEIRASLVEQQKTEHEVDFLFDAPAELAATVCGFNPNTFDGKVDLVELKVAQRDLMASHDQRPEAPAARPRKPGLLARLFGAR